MTNIKHRIGFRIKKWKKPALNGRFILLDTGIVENINKFYLLQENGFKIKL